MKNKTKKCCICGDDFVGWGNNPWPVVERKNAVCCYDCNFNVVIPSRIMLMYGTKKEVGNGDNLSD